MKLEYKQFIDLTSINDSMELESRQVIATLKMGNYLASLEVQGDVRVEYGGTAYRSPSCFPDELFQLFHDGKAYGNEDVYVDMNNWFEIFLYEKKNGKWKWTCESDVVDVERSKPHELLSLMIDYLNC